MLMLPLIVALATVPPPDPNGLLVWTVESALPEGADEFAADFTSNEPWMRALLDSGPVRDLPRSLAFLNDLWTTDPDVGSRIVERSMAAACALEIGERGRDREKMRQIYDFFIEHYLAEDLNPCFDDLATWERRFLAKGVQHGAYNALSSQEYLLDTICWPRAAYVKACWQAPYRLNNCFGDSIHGAMYYQPFNGIFESSAEKTLTVGAVCGGLSNVGAAAAIANGIPAFTMGEPGHCAYAVQTAPGTWSPAYSMSWKRGLHTSINRSTWPSHALTQASFSKPTAVANANDKRRLARWHATNSDPAAALSVFNQALRANPLDESLWEEALSYASDHDAEKAWWTQANSHLQRSLMADHPEPAWTVQWKHAIPHMLTDATSSERSRYFLRLLSNLEGWGSIRWNLEGALNAMDQSFANERERAAFQIDVVEQLVQEPKLGPVALAWATGKLGDDPEKKERFERAVLRRTKGTGEGRDAILRTLARSVLPAAATAHDLETFQRVGRAASRLGTPRPLLAASKIDPFAGSLLSRGGALSIYNPGNRWDSPETHWGVLEERGGDFHTDVGDLPWFEIELPHFGELTGIIFEGRHGRTDRYDGARILISADGEEWEQIATLEGRKIWHRIDLSASKPRGRFIRVERDGECMHFHRVLIYGKRAS